MSSVNRKHGVVSLTVAARVAASLDRIDDHLRTCEVCERQYPRADALAVCGKARDLAGAAVKAWGLARSRGLPEQQLQLALTIDKSGVNPAPF